MKIILSTLHFFKDTNFICRYVLVRFNERFAKEYQQNPAKIPEEWKKITEKEALDSLKESFSAPPC